MKTFASWSGGKDCMLAVHRAKTRFGLTVEVLLHMCHADQDISYSHKIKSSLIQEQAKCLDIALIIEKTRPSDYRENLKKNILNLKNKGFVTGIFGDIYLQEHRTWIEDLCAECAVTPVFPLWKENPSTLLKEFINAGFKSIIVSVNHALFYDKYIGKLIDANFLDELEALLHIDVCGEKGEYHSFVFDGPLFLKPVYFQKGICKKENQHTYLDLSCIK